VIELLIAVATTIIMFIVFGLLNKAIQSSRAGFTQHAGATLADLFVFLDPKKVWWMALGFTVFVGFAVTIVTGAWVVGLIAGVIAIFIPRRALDFLRTRREYNFVMQLPDALQSLTGSLRAGSSLNQALDLLVAETRGPVAQEFDLMQRELRMSTPFDVAVTNLHRRIPVAETQMLAASMRIARETGGNLAEVLERLSDTLRRKLEMEGKIRALTAQGKAQGWVMALLPLFLAWVLSYMEPESMSRLFTEPIGWGVCAFVVVMEFIGYQFIKKIVSIDV
jgi:tight adherence protein B